MQGEQRRMAEDFHRQLRAPGSFRNMAFATALAVLTLHDTLLKAVRDPQLVMPHLRDAPPHLRDAVLDDYFAGAVPALDCFDHLIKATPRTLIRCFKPLREADHRFPIEIAANGILGILNVLPWIDMLRAGYAEQSARQPPTIRAT
ncbi:hypothetical protein [Belnapia sp. F-4-1]|uniref:hypothetical protein n=1 Tax=Belnapia sp. F-4-1 TaxID=1545443 RepID=UPI001917225D|nr:hypothetical protein [Belnapia sp. F-4-1]